MIIDELIKYAEAIDASIVRELIRSKELAEQKFFTEASLRIGRAIEAGLYSVAREVNVNLNNRNISNISRITKSLRQAEVEIMRKRTPLEVRSLCNTAKLLSEAIARLTEDTNLREGESDSTTRPNEQLLRELIQVVDDEDIKQRLDQSQPFLRTIQNYRNDAAHASPEGIEREFDENKYENFIGEANDFLTLLFDFIIGERAKKSKVFKVG